jgi:hypothetical protein
VTKPEDAAHGVFRAGIPKGGLDTPDASQIALAHHYGTIQKINKS